MLSQLGRALALQKQLLLSLDFTRAPLTAARGFQQCNCKCVATGTVFSPTRDCFMATPYAIPKATAINRDDEISRYRIVLSALFMAVIFVCLGGPGSIASVQQSPLTALPGGMNGGALPQAMMGGAQPQAMMSRPGTFKYTACSVSVCRTPWHIRLEVNTWDMVWSEPYDLRLLPYDSARANFYNKSIFWRTNNPQLIKSSKHTGCRRIWSLHPFCNLCISQSSWKYISTATLGCPQNGAWEW